MPKIVMRKGIDMKPITTTQFIASFLSITVACIFLLLAAHYGRHLCAFFMMFLGLSSIVVMSKENRIRPMKTKEFLILGGFIVAVIGLGLLHLDKWGEQIEKGMMHPLFVFPFWTVMLFLTYRRWKIGQERSKDNTA